MAAILDGHVSRTGEGLRAHLAERETELKAGDHGERLTTVSGYVPSRVPVAGAPFAATAEWRAWHANATAELVRKREVQERRARVRVERERERGEARRERALFRGPTT